MAARLALRSESQVEIWNNPSVGSGCVYPQHHGTPLWFRNIYIKELK